MRYHRSRYWYGANEPSKYTKLQSTFGDAVRDIKGIFLSLKKQDLETLLAEYGALHGEATAAYARKTFADWKSGKTTLSGKTMERLIELVPPFLLR